MIIGCTPKQVENILPFEASINPSFQPIEGAFHFYTIGDWGRDGKYGQKELAKTMGMAALQVQPEFIISTGDNFYPYGVTSIEDPLWKTSFEDIYTDQSLHCEWFVVPGNHDYMGSVDAEIEYSEVSERWNMPSRYFHKDIVTDEGVSIRFLFIDTSPLNDNYYSNKYADKVIGQDTARQLQWIDSMLVGDFDWKIVTGHHPLYTGGTRKREKNYVRDYIEKLLDKHQVDLYLAGHEHDLQHIKPKGHPTHHFISGAGSSPRATGKISSTIFAESIQGFLSTAITKNLIQCQFVNLYGEIIYKTEIIK